MKAWPGGKVQKIYRLRHILYDSMTWWLSSEQISLTSHPLWQHGLVVKFDKFRLRHILYDSMTWWLISENISLTSHPLWQPCLVVKFRKDIACVTPFMTAWPGGQFQKIYRWRHILYDSIAWWLSSGNISLTSHPLWHHGLVINIRKYISWRHILYDSMAWWLSTENISLTSHHLWQHGLVVNFRKYIADVISFMTG